MGTQPLDGASQYLQYSDSVGELMKTLLALTQCLFLFCALASTQDEDFRGLLVNCPELVY